MLFTFLITTTGPTTEANKKKSTLALCQGRITRLAVVFPTGSAGLLHFHLNRALHQIFPKSPGETLSGDGFIYNSQEVLEITEPPFELEAYTWNLDDTYDHDVIVMIEIIPYAVLEELRKFKEAYEAITTLTGV